jgi:hypothetical protein
MKRLIYTVVAASALGLAAGGALACEQHTAHNASGAAAAKGKLAMTTAPIVTPDRVVRDSEDPTDGTNTENGGGDSAE